MSQTQSVGTDFALTDTGNAERLVSMQHDRIRHVHGLGWLAWDGRRWMPDTTGELMRLAKLTARAIYHDAAGCDDDDERKRIAGWARSSESEPRRRAMISLAASELPVIATIDELDADPWALTVANGVVDLRTGGLRAHRPRDLATKIAPVAYNPAAQSDRWDRFIARVTGGDLELAGFLQRLAGYTLVGDTAEEILAFIHGPGATGKTTFVEAIKAVLGDYASTADFETFLQRRGDAGIRNDVARLAGARMVTSVEVEDGSKFAVGLVKQVTGGDKIAARFLHKEYFEFQPRFTLWLVANARPRAAAADDALWRRIVQVPFTVVIPTEDRDPELKRALRADPDEQTAILAWLVSGCLQWQQQGLAIPAVVRDYTNAYRAENDPLAEWIGDCCILDAQGWTAAGELRASYERWCDQAGTRPIDGRRPWGHALEAHDCKRGGRNGIRGWHGIDISVRQ